MSAFIGVYLM